MCMKSWKYSKWMLSADEHPSWGWQNGRPVWGDGWVLESSKCSLFPPYDVTLKFKALEKLVCMKVVLGILISEQGGGISCEMAISYRYRTEDIFFPHRSKNYYRSCHVKIDNLYLVFVKSLSLLGGCTFDFARMVPAMTKPSCRLVV